MSGRPGTKGEGSVGKAEEEKGGKRGKLLENAYYSTTKRSNEKGTDTLSLIWNKLYMNETDFSAIS